MTKTNLLTSQPYITHTRFQAGLYIFEFGEDNQRGKKRKKENLRKIQLLAVPNHKN